MTAPNLSSEHLILSHRGMQYFVTYLTGVVAAYWVVIDSVRLRRALKSDRGKGAVRDQIFGSIVGLVIGAIGIIGAYLGSP